MDDKHKRDRNPGNDLDVPSEVDDREAQDRAKPTPRSGGARSPVDSQHVDSPSRQDNERGHRKDR